MALLDNPRSASILALFLAVLVGYIGYSGDGLRLLGARGLKERAAQAAASEDTVRALEASIDSSKRELASGSAEEIRRALARYRAILAVLRQFVPEQSEVPDLLDDISSRAKIRGVNVANFAPQPIAPGPAPFDTYSYEMSVIGRYDQVGLFLSDVAGLRRIMVPEEVVLTAADPAKARALGDSSTAMLEAKFKLRTYVKATGGTDGT